MSSANSQPCSVRCGRCQKVFQTISSRNRHLRNIHKDDSQNSKKLFHIICPLCSNRDNQIPFKSFESLMQHQTNVHGVKFERKQLEFSTQEAFEIWKQSIEKESKSFYYLNATRSIESTLGKIYYYECHRSNLTNFKSKCVVRAPKVSGSIKISGVCTSRIRAEVHNDGSKVCVEYVSTHVGHELELRCQPLSENEKSDIIEQIRLGVSFDTILKKARNIEGNECSRLNLLTLKDIYYLAEKNHLVGKRHKSDFVAVEMKVAEWNSDGQNVFIFKKVGEHHNILEVDDFALAYMNKEMEYMLKTYGPRIICLDGTHGTNPYDFELTTVLVLDDQHIGHPVVFLISNRKDTIIQEVLLKELKSITGVLIPKYLMTDDTPIYWNAWNNIMGTVPQRLLCTWHIKKNWAIQCRSKITEPEKRKKIQKDLDQLLKETEKTEFIRLKNKLIQYLQHSNEISFLNYLQTYYFQNEERISAWAHSYRRHAGINTNMHLETLHKNLKYKYFCGKTVRRLETCLDALDKLIIDKSWQRIASILRPTATHRDLLVNKFHKRAMSMSLDAVAEENWCKFLVHSASKIDFYQVDLVDPDCNCRTLSCKQCNICIHRYKCSCYEAAVKNNLCKHIHLVSMYIMQKATENTHGIQQVHDDHSPSVVQQNLNEELNLRIGENSGKETVEPSVEPKNTEKIEGQCKHIFNSILNQCDAKADYEYVLKHLIQMKSHFDTTNLPSPIVSKRKKIEKQTFFSNKKKRE